MQAHVDVVVFSETNENHIEANLNHVDEHHKNDSENEKNTEHHHHCSSVNLLNIFIPVENKVDFIDFYQFKKSITYYTNTNYSYYQGSVFQPPKNFKL